MNIIPSFIRCKYRWGHIFLVYNPFQIFFHINIVFLKMRIAVAKYYNKKWVRLM